MFRLGGLTLSTPGQAVNPRADALPRLNASLSSWRSAGATTLAGQAWRPRGARTHAAHRRDRPPRPWRWTRAGLSPQSRSPRPRHLRCSCTHGPGPHPQLLDHRAHRPRQVDAGGSHPRADAHGGSARDARAAAGLDGPGARARDHDQGAGGARVLHGARRRDLPAAPDRHARARGLHVRGLALAGRMRGRAAGGGRRAGRGGADGGQHLPGGGRGPRADPVPEQDRPARRGARAGGGRSERSDRRVAGVDPADQRQDRRGRGGGAGGAGRARAAAGRATPTARRGR